MSGRNTLVSEVHQLGTLLPFISVHSLRQMLHTGPSCLTNTSRSSRTYFTTWESSRRSSYKKFLRKCSGFTFVRGYFGPIKQRTLLSEVWLIHYRKRRTHLTGIALSAGKPETFWLGTGRMSQINYSY